MQIIGGVDQSTNRLWAEIVDGEVTQGIVNPFVYHLREDGAWVLLRPGRRIRRYPLAPSHGKPFSARIRTLR